MINAIIISVNYADYLKYTLPITKKYINEIVVVTIEDDKETIAVCEENDVTCIATDNLCYENGDIFNKGKMVNHGLKYLYDKYDNDSWFLSIDADIILHSNIANIDLSTLDEDCVYSCSRYLCWDWNTFIKFYDNDCDFGVLEGLPGLDYRNYKKESIAFGFFNLYKKKYFYSEGYKTAAGIDIDFSKRFGKIDYFDFPVMHLGQDGVNWEGRESPKWENPDV